ncbi:MAG: PorV/PorQ family protein [Candidatus Marinimicrobia bacterium]|nr:PorV/PorQ family protein [Candidatus Neomarinimicrobiota bacterium]
MKGPHGHDQRPGIAMVGPFMGALLVLCLSLPLHAQQTSNAGTSAAAFLEIGVGARAMGMGQAFVSLAQDATAMYWNPAGISRIATFEAMFTYVDWFVDTKYAFTGIVAPIPGRGAVGLSVTHFGAAAQPVRIVGQEEGTGEFYTAQDIALGLTLALNLTNRFSFGLSSKFIRQQIWHTSGQGFAMDVGVLYKTGLEGMNIGISISNFGSPLQLSGRDLLNVIDPDILNSGVEKIRVNYETDPFELPLLARFGLSYQRTLFGEGNHLTVVADLQHPSNDTESINVGAELLLMNAVSLRMGANSLLLQDRTGGFSLGGGLVVRSFGAGQITLDYAYVDWGFLRELHYFTVGLAL